ncbi:MAG TPA: VOC family protein [Candidatus Kapabacteria bacterium]|nr:VOC family protein [Candidatus Kapabacteria bacterium]
MTKSVTGIGGIFFRSQDDKALAAWYEKHFGVNMFWQSEAGPTVFAPSKADTDYFGNMQQQFMINFRVSDLDSFLAELKAAGVKTDEKTMNESYGKFAWVYDPEGNKIELWEPAD